jgi:hypothetical protein
MSADAHSSEHEFKGAWRWPTKFEGWIASLIDDVSGPTVNVCAGLSPVGDVRVDLKTPVELVKNLRQDSGTNMVRAREYMEDLVVDDPPFDVVGSLYGASDPANHPAAEYIKPLNTIRADVLDDEGLPFGDSVFAGAVCDPPWKDLNDAERSHLFEELVRITEPGGVVIFNSYWTPTGDLPITLDYMDIRRDLSRWDSGTPNMSWVCIYTVHDSLDTARHRSRTLGRDYEYVPPTNTLNEAIRAEAVYKMTHVDGVPSNAFKNDIVDPTSEHSCPMCDSADLYPVGEGSTDDYSGGDLYECGECKFRATEKEITGQQKTEWRGSSGSSKVIPQIEP